MASYAQNNNRSLLRIISGVVVLILMALAIFLLAKPSGTSSTTATNGLRVVAAENFWGNIAGQIGGSHVQVTSIITDPTADPHLYESNAKNAAAVSSAEVVIVNGLGYDDFMSKLLNASKNSNRQVLAIAQILGVSGPDANPHMWYDISRVSNVAERIAASYEAKDPAHKQDYAQNLSSFTRSLQPLLQMIATIKQRYSGTPVAYTERVPGYLLQNAGLDVKTPPGFAKSIEDGNDPSPTDTATMESLVTAKAVRVLLYNAQATSPVTKHVRDLAAQVGIPIVAVTETLPTNEPTYQSWQQHQLNDLLKALETR